MDIIKCRLILHSKAKHLNQIYTGFLKLKKEGILTITKECIFDTDKQILEVIINDSIKVIYDTMDEEDFYAVTMMNIKNIDYYFKRSFKSEIAKSYNFKSFPLGLNYNVYSEYGNLLGKKEDIKNRLKKVIKKNKYSYIEKDFEYYPFISETPKICFLTRVWDINAPEIENDEVREERKSINEFRVACIKACKEKFGERFIGGIEDSEFARINYSEYIVKDKSITNKDNFIDLVKSTEICVATTGLHKSIGWKFGEYIAASRAIVTEPLYYELPGEISVENNYLQFTKVDELISILEELIEDKNKIKKLMVNNFKYYNNYVRPDMIIINSLLKMEL